jgi:hypothetical protein
VKKGAGLSLLLVGVVVAASVMLGGCASGADEREPAPTESPATNTPAAATVPGDGKIRHTVVRGESLSDLAERYGVTVAAIVEENYHLVDPPQSILDFFERLHAGEGCMFYPGYTMIIPVAPDE